MNVTIITDLLDLVTENYSNYDIQVMYSQGIKQQMGSRYASYAKLEKFDAVELQIIIYDVQIKLTHYNMFIRLQPKNILFWIYGGIATTAHHIDRHMLVFANYYNQLIELAENVMGQSVEEFTDRRITTVDDTPIKQMGSRFA